MSSEWDKCVEPGCSATCTVCRTCRIMHKDRCAQHAKDRYPIGRHSYCKECVYKFYCTGCDKVQLTFCTSRCTGYSCPVTNTLCSACGSPLKDNPTDPGHMLCESHLAKVLKAMICNACGQSSKAQFTCRCCEQNFCDKCDKQLTVDISPVTIYGRGFSVYNCAHFCRACTGKKTIQAIQKDYRNYGRYKCDAHSTVQWMLDHAPFILCAKYKKPDNTDVVVCGTMNVNKQVVSEFEDEAFEAIDQYCNEHPNKRVRFDGHVYIWPEQK